MMSLFQGFHPCFSFSAAALRILKIIALTKSQPHFVSNIIYFECKNYAATSRRFRAEFNIHTDSTIIIRIIMKFKENRCLGNQSIICD